MEKIITDDYIKPFKGNLHTDIRGKSLVKKHLVTLICIFGVFTSLYSGINMLAKTISKEVYEIQNKPIRAESFVKYIIRKNWVREALYLNNDRDTILIFYL